MKKILLGLFLSLTMVSFADDKYDYIEDKLELKYQQLVDNKNNKLDIEGIDVGTFGNKLYVKIEMETFSGDGGWEKFDKVSYEKIAKNIADEVRQMLDTNSEVEVSLILEKEMGDKDILLASKIY
ncbi:MAG: hypothetical protein MR673_09855 [Fusobacterium perfoetens]|uniref:hypothetical protein n=1 Tax=Fusobacterium perfoetens TaxID=852 RepID=UPI0023F18E98|nr:hypothetical protein [Fusobacterium perfoetens]MCI6153407.1 hypothetical protein [Fusobacterium perfoetens]MDY3238450.1 hypothetical protein [Fusobacterium perfoetens]